MSPGLVFRNWTAGFLLSCAGAFVFAADVYDIDPRHTFSTFEYDHWGLSRQQGRFDSTRGHIEISPESGKGEIAIEINAASVNTGIDAFNKLLRSPDFFDVESNPAIVFTSSRLRFDGERLIEVEGDLNIKGIKRPLTLKIHHYHYRCRFMLIYGAQACGANGSAMILRSDFELGRYTPFVSDQITLHISVEAIRRNPPSEQ